MKQQSSRIKRFKWIKINESRKIYAIKRKHDLLKRKDTESVHLQRTIDKKIAQKIIFLDFLNFKPNILIFFEEMKPSDGLRMILNFWQF